MICDASVGILYSECLFSQRFHISLSCLFLFCSPFCAFSLLSFQLEFSARVSGYVKEDMCGMWKTGLHPPFCSRLRTARLEAARRHGPHSLDSLPPMQEDSR